MVEKRWSIPSLDEAHVDRLRAELGCSRLLARLLVHRGLTAADSAERFLRPKLTQLHDPFLLPNLELAVERVLTAIRGREKIAIVGDYDVDGLSSTALLHSYFAQIRFPVLTRIPNRLTEGYGIKPAVVYELAEQGVELIITVDNGVSANEAVAAARARGVDVVVLDHHQPPAVLPEAVAIVDPWLPGSEYPFSDLAGVGVTFKFVWALCQRWTRQTKLSDEYRRFLLESLGLVALGTISDVVPLLGENRVLAKFGLRALEETSSPGLRCLVDRALRPGESRLDGAHVGFRIGPVLNAAGRLGRAEAALELLMTDDASRAAELTAELGRENDRRRRIEKRIAEEVRDRVRESVDLSCARAIVLGSEDWHPGVIGIVASRAVDEFHRPTLIVSLDGARGRGSGRSIPGVDLARALDRCSDVLAGHGGHEMAAGFEVDRTRLDELRTRLEAAIELDPLAMVPTVEADQCVALDELDAASVREVELLEPFGAQNAEPVFQLDGLEVVGTPRVMGSTGDHLSFHVRQGDVSTRAVAFGMGDWQGRLSPRQSRVSLLAAPRLSTWNRDTQLELHVRDIRMVGSP